MSNKAKVGGTLVSVIILRKFLWLRLTAYTLNTINAEGKVVLTNSKTKWVSKWNIFPPETEVPND